jgi:hypothetical protein
MTRLATVILLAATILLAFAGAVRALDCDEAEAV